MAAIQNNDKYIGQLMIKEGVITETELQMGLEEQEKQKDFLCHCLVKLGFASEEKIFSILSLQIGIPFLKLDEIKVDPAVLNRLTGDFALACKCMPIKIKEGVFYIAMADPLNNRALMEIKSYLGADRLKVFLSGDNDIRESIGKYYGV